MSAQQPLPGVAWYNIPDPTSPDLDVFLGRDFLITVHKSDCAVIARVQQLAQQNQITRLDQIFYRLLDLTVDDYLTMLDRVGEHVGDLESDVLEHPGPEVLQEIFRLKRKLIEFRRNAADMREVVNTLVRRERGLIGDDLDPYLRDVYDHLLRVVDLLETYRDLLTGSLDIYLSAVANRT